MKPVRATLFQPARGMTTEQVLREALMRTPAGRAWRQRYLRRLEAHRLRESGIARRSRPEWGSSPGGRSYSEHDEIAAHDVKTKSLADDLRRKKKIRRSTKKQSDPASGEISKLLTEPEALEQSSTLGSRPDGMGRATLYEHEAECACESCEGAVRATLAESQDWQRTGMDADRAEEPGDDEVGDEDSWRERFNYRLASDPSVSCGTCRFYNGAGGCVKFDAMVRAVDRCDAWEQADATGRKEESMRPSARAIRVFEAAYRPKPARGRRAEALRLRAEALAKKLAAMEDEAARREAIRRCGSALQAEGFDESEIEGAIKGAVAKRAVSREDEGDYHQDRAPGPKPTFGDDDEDDD